MPRERGFAPDEGWQSIEASGILVRRGMLSAMNPFIAAMTLVTLCALVQAQEPLRSTESVRPGIEVFLSAVPERIRGKRIGLITNHAGIDRAGTSDIDLIAAHPDVKLVALFAAEHGIRGVAAAGEKVADARDPKSGLPIFSLYMAEDRGPTPEMLKEIDALVYDLPEVGGRTWTYVSTMALSMRAAARKGIPFVVLDRPNPIGGEIVEGALLDPAFKSFVGMYPIPARHGMTVGELATFFNKEFGIGVDLIVARTAGWRRAQWFADTGLPWRNPSPNLRSPAALNSYPGTVYFEGTNLTEGRGTDRPFEQVGAPWLDAPAVVKTMNARRLHGSVRGHHDGGGARGGQVSRTDHSRDPVCRHGSGSLPPGADVAAADRRNPAAASEGIRVGHVDR